MASREPKAAAQAGWRDLTWEDLEAWTDARSLQRGKSYQRSGHVQQLALSPDGELLAWVMGTQRYTTRVKLVSGNERTLDSLCTCPVGSNGCKHAVAVVL